MGIFDLFKKKESKPQDVIQQMLTVAAAAYQAGSYDKAFATYKNVLDLEPNPEAMFNMGILYAQGNGVAQDYTKAGVWFRKASLAGDKDAEKYIAKTLLDMIKMMLSEGKGSKFLFEAVRSFETQVYGDAQGLERAAEALYQAGQLYMSKEQYDSAAVLFRASAEYGGHGLAANWTGVLYNAGAGVEKNDLAALYWLDKAVDRGVSVSRNDRDGILNAYRSNYGQDEFSDLMHELTGYCAKGSIDIPRDSDKESYWENMKYKA